MPEEIFDISFSEDGKTYTGWVHPSDKKNAAGLSVSYHVVLNGVFFGDLSLNESHWSINENRPASLVKATGAAISRALKL